jgi:hypothetical protein
VCLVTTTGAPRMNWLPTRPPLARNSAVFTHDMIRTAIVPTRSSNGVHGRASGSAIASHLQGRGFYSSRVRQAAS